MNYRERRKQECLKLFEGFYPNVSRSREPKVVLQVFELARQGYYSNEIAEIVGKTPKAIQKIYRRYHFPTLYNFAPPILEERQGWKGGLKKDRTGHIYKKCPNHPFASKYGGYVALHRLVVEEHIGRYLLPTEVVHHIDDNPANNDISNLRVYENNAAHLRDTLKGKCPQWSAEGKRRLLEVAHQRHLKALEKHHLQYNLPLSTNPSASENGA